MQRKNNLLPRPLYYVLGAIVVVCWVLFSAHVTGVGTEWAKDDAEIASKRIPRELALNRSQVIQAEAKADRDYTPDEFARHNMELLRYENHASLDFQSLQTWLINRMHEHADTRYAADLVGLEGFQREATVRNLILPQLTLANAKYAEKDGSGLKRAGNFFKHLLILGVMFSGGALLLLMLRVLRHSQRLGQAIAIVQSDWREILINSVMWMWGLSEDGYNPLKNWEARVAERAYAMGYANDSWRTTREAAAMALATEAEQILPKKEALLAVLKVIWGAFDWRQTVSAVKSRTGRTQVRRELCTCMYLSAVAVIYISCGYKIAYADDAKEAPPISGVTIVSNADLRGVNDTADHLFLFGRKGTTLTLLGFTGSDPQLELVQPLGRILRKHFYAEVGPFADVALTGSGNRLRAYGLSGFFTGTVGRVKYGGPAYLATDGEGSNSLWMPGTWALYKLTDRFSLGLGSSLFATAGVGVTANLGPLAEYSFNKSTALRARYTNGGWGGFAGTGPSMRLDLITRF